MIILVIVAISGWLYGLFRDRQLQILRIEDKILKVELDMAKTIVSILSTSEIGTTELNMARDFLNARDFPKRD